MIYDSQPFVIRTAVTANSDQIFEGNVASHLDISV